MDILLLLIISQICFKYVSRVFKVFSKSRPDAATLSREGGHRGELGGPRHLEPVRDVVRDVSEVPQRERRAGRGKHPADADAHRPNRRGPAPPPTKKKHLENTLKTRENTCLLKTRTQTYLKHLYICMCCGFFFGGRGALQDVCRQWPTSRFAAV